MIHTPVSSESISDTTIAEIEQQTAGDGVWIDPAFARAHDISAADETAIEDAVASAQQSGLKVVLVEVDSADDRFQGSFANLSAWLHDDTGGDATYVGYDTWGEPQLSIQPFGDQPDTRAVANVAEHEHPGDVAAQVVRIQELLDSGNAKGLWAEVPRDERYSWTADEGMQVSEWAVGAGIVIALVIAASALLAWRRRRPSGFVLPTTVLHTVRAAEDRRLRQQADAEVLALGEALGSGEPSGTAHSLDAWQQALDHFAAARTILSQAAAPADVVGALVLAQRGESARGAARTRKPSAWKPPVCCWFNPLHDGATTEATWRDADSQVDVPACGACAADIRAGREPDALDFIQGDRTVHYFRLDLGVWSRTGYGTLEPDLIGALQRGHKSRPGLKTRWATGGRGA